MVFRNTTGRGDFLNPDYAVGGCCISWVNHGSTAELSWFLNQELIADLIKMLFELPCLRFDTP